MQSIIGRFIGFDKLIGPVLVKLVYYSGMAGIGLFIVATFFMGLMSFAGGNFVNGFITVFGALIVGAAMLVYWRFACELFMLSFKTYERLGEIRDGLSAGGQRSPPDFSQF